MTTRIDVEAMSLAEYADQQEDHVEYTCCGIEARVNRIAPGIKLVTCEYRGHQYLALEHQHGENLVRI